MKKIASKIDIDSIVKWLLLCGWFVLFIGGVTHYPGSWLTYSMFSLAFLAMLISGFYRQVSYGHLFLVVMLWLGFWLKLTIHSILRYPFVEAQGSFAEGGAAWDEVLHVATVASLGVILGKQLYRLLESRMPDIRREVMPKAPPWYANHRILLWAGLTVTAAGVVFLNLKYGVHIIGLLPRTILMWPLNALIAWTLNIGLATGVGMLLWWDIVLKKNVTISIYAIIAEAALSSVSILSRSVYVFHSIPQLLAAYRLKRNLNGWAEAKTFVVGIVFAVFLVMSISAITTFRNYLYQSGAYLSTAASHAIPRVEVLKVQTSKLEQLLVNAAPREKFQVEDELRKKRAEIARSESLISEEKMKWSEAMKSGSSRATLLADEFGYQVSNGVFSVILQLSVDRWIGLEGLMAVQSYRQKNMALLKDALREKPEAGKTDIYQTISNSIYLKSDRTKFKFATLPGAVAFLYYSNSILVVMLGMAVFTFVIVLLEYLILKFTANPILCSLYGAAMASIVAQFGSAPRESISYYLMFLGGILPVWLVQSDFCAMLVRRLKLF